MYEVVSNLELFSFVTLLRYKCQKKRKNENEFVTQDWVSVFPAATDDFPAPPSVLLQPEDPVWVRLVLPEASPALSLQWAACLAHSNLLASLHIDSRNIVSTRLILSFLINRLSMFYFSNQLDTHPSLRMVIIYSIATTSNIQVFDNLKCTKEKLKHFHNNNLVSACSLNRHKRLGLAGGLAPPSYWLLPYNNIPPPLKTLQLTILISS